MPTILITGGRAPVALDFARKFQSAGWRVLVAESMPVHLCQHSKAVDRCFTVPSPRFESDAFINQLCEIVQAESVDLVLPTCEEVFTIAKGYDRLSAYCTVFTESLGRLLPLHSKFQFIETAKQYGLSVPATRFLENPHSTIGKGVVLKPEFSRFATETILCPESESDIENIEIGANHRWIEQDYIAGRQICTYSIAHEGIITAHVAYETVITAGQGATIAFEVLNHEATEAWVRQFVECYGFSGQIAFDFIETDAGDVYAIECNPRAISGVHLFDESIVSAIVGRVAVSPLIEKRVAVWLAVLVFGWQFAPSLRRWLRSLRDSQDVIFSLRDPLPYLAQFMMLWHVSGICRREHLNLIQATTFDIEWNSRKEELCL